MPKLPRISGEGLIRVLERRGYKKVRSKGSHARLYPPENSGLKKVTVPLHTELKMGTLSNIIKDAGLTADDLKN